MVALAKQANIIPFPSCSQDAPMLPTKSNEWYTPSYIIEAARKVLGTIDLDPASCEQANQVVRATRFYTAQDNGLAQKWYGNVWLNPPYGRTAKMRGQHLSTIKLFVDKLIESYQSGAVQQAVLLATCRSDAAWFRPLWRYPICFADHKVGFYCPRTGQYLQEQSHTHGTIFVYFGPHEQQFIDTFEQFGPVAKSIAGPRRDTVQASLWNMKPIK